MYKVWSYSYRDHLPKHLGESIAQEPKKSISSSRVSLKNVFAWAH